MGVARQTRRPDGGADGAHAAWASSRAGYMGDDVIDLPVLRACGFSATVADGHDEVKSRVDYVAAKGGGRGAVREVCELILRAQGKWQTAMAGYLA
jgi:3-deoxy-D-manno-octulosonate 8-phosphate phosphatase (KDO 8-P phosphatase)